MYFILFLSKCLQNSAHRVFPGCQISLVIQDKRGTGWGCVWGLSCLNDLNIGNMFRAHPCENYPNSFHSDDILMVVPSRTL